jgi:type IV pilus assembly protein PilP
MKTGIANNDRRNTRFQSTLVLVGIMLLAVFMMGMAGCAKDTTTSAKPPAPSQPEKKKVSLEELTAMQEVVPQKFIYDPKGLKDPFMPIEAVKSDKQRQTDQGEDAVPLTPLQKLELSQFKLVAVVMSGEDSRALVEDGAGLGYIIQNGTPIGMRGGHVISILKDKVQVEEYTVNYLGEKKTLMNELKLHPIEEGENR